MAGLGPRTTSPDSHYDPLERIELDPPDGREHGDTDQYSDLGDCSGWPELQHRHLHVAPSRPQRRAASSGHHFHQIPDALSEVAEASGRPRNSQRAQFHQASSRFLHQTTEVEPPLYPDSWNRARDLTPSRPSPPSLKSPLSRHPMRYASSSLNHQASTAPFTMIASPTKQRAGTVNPNGVSRGRPVGTSNQREHAQHTSEASEELRKEISDLINETTSRNTDQTLAPDSTPIPPTPTAPATPTTTIIFGRDLESLDTIISRHHLKKLPADSLARLARKGAKEGTILTIANSEEVGILTRLKQFLESGAYEPFNPKVALEYVDGNKATQTWRNENRGLFTLTAKTKHLFNQEVRLYIFAHEIRYEDLVKLSSRNIRLHYPLSIDGILLLLGKALPAAKAAGDLQMLEYIKLLIKKHNQAIASHQDFSKVLKFWIEDEGTKGSISSLLLEVLNSASPRATQNRSDTSNTAGHPNNPHGQFVDSTRLLPRDLAKFVKALQDGYLYVAVDNGYGTLVSKDRRGRNQDFKFQRGEILLVERDATGSTNPRLNVIVYNSNGDKGDILGHLIKQVPFNLGMFNDGTMVVGSRMGSVPEPRQERLERSERLERPDPRPDREVRTSYRHSMSGRGRSRSPHPRY